MPHRIIWSWYPLAVDGRAVIFGTARKGQGGAAARPGPSSLYQKTTFCYFTSGSGYPPLGTLDCLPITGVVSGATAARLLQCSVGWYSIRSCTALAIGNKRACTARLSVIKVRSHHAAPTPITLAESSMADRLQAGRLGLQNVFVAWHRHTSLTNFIIQQSRSFEGVCVPLRLTNCLFPVPDSQPTATKHFQSPLYGSGTVFHSISHLLRHFPSSALAGRHTCSNSVTRNYCCRAREVTLSFMDTLIAFTISLTYHQEQDVNEIDRPISKRWRRIDFSDVKIVHNAIILQWWRLWGYVAVRCVKLAIFGPLCYRGFKTVSNMLSVNKSNDDDITAGGV